MTGRGSLQSTARRVFFVTSYLSTRDSLESPPAKDRFFFFRRPSRRIVFFWMAAAARCAGSFFAVAWPRPLAAASDDNHPQAKQSNTG